MRIILTYLCFQLILAFSGKASAQDIQDAHSLFDAGEFCDLVGWDETRLEFDADILSVMARAAFVLGRYNYEGRDRDTMLERGRTLAERALQQTPNHYEAHLQLAAYYGYWASVENSPKLGKKAKEHIKSALETNSAHAWGHAAMAGWHAEVVARAGGLFARLLFGASRNKAQDEINAAEGAIEGQTILTLASIMRAHLRMNPDDKDGAAASIWRQIHTMSPQTALDTLLLKEADAMGAALEARNDETVTGYLKALKPISLRSCAQGQFGLEP